MLFEGQALLVSNFFSIFMSLFLVLEGGLEPPPEYSDCTLNAARLPVPPLELEGKIMILVCYFNLQSLSHLKDNVSFSV